MAKKEVVAIAVKNEKGIKETKEIIYAAGHVIEFIFERAKDGIAIDDVIALIQQAPSFYKDFQKAADNAGEVPAELNDLTPEELKELISCILEKIVYPILGNVIKKK